MRFCPVAPRDYVKIALALLLCLIIDSPAVSGDVVGGQDVKPGKLASGGGDLSSAPSQIPNGPAGASRRSIVNDASAKSRGNVGDGVPDESRPALLANVEMILASAYRLEPVEHRIIVETEAASLIWDLDKARALSVLTGVFDRVRALQRDRSSVKAAGLREQVRMWVLRRAARLDSGLVTAFLAKDETNDDTARTVAGDWSEEGRTVLAVAFDQIERDPIAAARLADQSLTLGLADLPGFLRQLSQSDAKLAQQQAISYMSRLRDSSAPPFFLLNFRSFVFSQSASARLREAYFEALAVRLRRDVNAELPAREIADSLQAARAAAQIARGSGQWPDEFDRIIAAFEQKLTAASQTIPGPPRRVAVDFSDVNAAEGETRELEEAASNVAAIMDRKTRDKQYRELAVKAAFRADVGLTENLLSRIEDEGVRRFASVAAYTPFVRRALRDANTTQASMYAMRISEPLARSLVVDWIARTVRDKAELKEIFEAALLRSHGDPRSQAAAKGAFILARTMLDLDAGRPFETLGWAVRAMNTSTEAPVLLSDSETSREVEAWVKLPSGMHRTDEMLDSSDLIVQAFEAFGRRDGKEAQALAMSLADRGLSLLARTGVARAEKDRIKSVEKPRANFAERLKRNL